MLRVVGLTKTVPGKTILQKLDFTAERGSIVGLLGPSGSGKTTFLRTLMGFEEVGAGTISYNGRILTDGRTILVPPHRRNFGLVFQEFVLLPHLNVAENIALAVRNSSKAAIQETVNRFLAMFHMEDRAHSRVTTLSGGEQQRVALARTLAAGPDVVLLDEPFSNLDKMFRLQLYDEMKTILRERATTTILVTHDHLEAFYFSDRVCVIREGCIIQEGSPEEVYEKPRNSWIASFVGDVNHLSPDTLRSDLGVALDPDPGTAVYLIRPERLSFEAATKGEGGNGRIVQRNYMGGFEMLAVRLDSGALIKLKDFEKRGLPVGSLVRVRCASVDNLIRCRE